MDGTEHKCNMIEVQEFVQNTTHKKDVTTDKI